MASHQIHRMLGITYKTAWFMTHRIRYAMDQKPERQLKGTVEADETYVGGKAHGKRGRGVENKTPVFSLVERKGKVMSTIVERITGRNLGAIMVKNIDKSTNIMTDEFRSYRRVSKNFVSIM